MLGKSLHSLTTKAGKVRPDRLHIFQVDPVVADQGIGHGDDFPGIGGVGENLLITGHAGIEDHLAGDLPGRAEGLAMKNPAVGKGENGFHDSITP